MSGTERSPHVPPTSNGGCCRRAASPARHACRAPPGWPPAAAAAAHPPRLHGAAQGSECATNRTKGGSRWLAGSRSRRVHPRQAEQVGRAHTLRAARRGLERLQLGAGPGLMHTAPTARRPAACLQRDEDVGRAEATDVCCLSVGTGRRRAAAGTAAGSLSHTLLYCDAADPTSMPARACAACLPARQL